MDTASPEERLSHLVVFTDLDGTLLDAEDYSFDRALSALGMLETREIPLIFCTSKTRAEVEPIRERLGNRDPFVVENGGAVYIPKNYFAGPFDYDAVTDDYLVIELGAPYPEVIADLERMKRETGVPLRGFSDMSVGEIAQRCKLTPLQAREAKRRKWDEPFMILEPEATNAVLASAEYPVVGGGRFYHLAASDKGRGVSVVMDLARRFWGEVTSVGIGNGPNDIPMLRAVDLPIMVGLGQDAAGRDDRLRRLRRIDETGPAGWNLAVTMLLAGEASVPAP